MTDTPTEHGWHVDDRCVNCDVAHQLAPGLIAEETTSRMRALATRTAAPRPRPVDFAAMRW